MKKFLFLFSSLLSLSLHIFFLLLYQFFSLEGQKEKKTSENLLSLIRVFEERKFVESHSEKSQDSVQESDFIGDKNQSETSSSIEESEETELASLEGTQTKYLSSVRENFSSQKGGDALKNLKQNKEMLPSENFSPMEIQLSSSRDSEESKGGRQMRITSLRGTIRENGRGSFSIEDSLLGRYQAKLGRIVERTWQNYCVIYREHIAPGIITVRFVVASSGEVTEIHILKMIKSSEIQKGFTLRAIQESPFLPIPSEILETSKEKSLEFIYNFYFQ